MSSAIPGSRVEVEVVSVQRGPPDEADAGGLMEGQQGVNDEVSLGRRCGHRQQALPVTPSSPRLGLKFTNTFSKASSSLGTIARLTV